MCNIDDLAKLILLCDTCCLYQYISTIYFSLVESCGILVVVVFVFEAHEYIIRYNWAFGHAIKQISYWYVLWLHLDFMLILFSNYSCVCMFLSDINLCDCYLPRDLYTWDWLLLELISFYLESTYFILSNSLVAPEMTCLVSAYFIYYIWLHSYR
jgi:hypothetical protein